MGTASLARADEPIALKYVPEFDELYETYSETVYRTALRVTGNSADAEDVLQNVFLRLFNNRIVVDGDKSPVAYLRRAATNTSIDLLRQRASRPDSQAASLDSGGRYDRSAHQGPPLLKEALRRALARIAPADAELFVLCYLEGYSYDELAEMFGMESGTVASRLFRIRATLRKDLNR
jgi:RNA polymerase sigma-70 factor (ECF subfamily)